MIKGMFSLSKVLIANLGAFKKMRYSASGEKYIRPPRRYEILEYREGIKCCISDEKYLRPTRYCNPHAPEVIALANELGAFEKSDREFAEVAFDFAKRKLTLEILPMDGVENTLRRGTGTCIHEISVFIALCRAAGIKARYKLYAPSMIQSWNDALMVDDLLKKWYETMGYFMLHGEGEAYVDGEWVVVDVGSTPERQAAASIPITKFGEDSIGVWFSAMPDSVMHVESFPYGMDVLLKLAKKVTPRTLDKVNASIIGQIEKGKNIIEEAGGEWVYDEKARRKKVQRAPKVELEPKKEIVFVSEN
ncbi:MAG: transglutaminase family protein [Candidatus Thermoplasmatota archaeon]|nr:transglutaminase family protein [Candidatus Thermoplasmatota archaeon]